MLPASKSPHRPTPRHTEDLWGDSWKQRELLPQLPSDLSLHVAVVCLFSVSHLRGALHWPVKVDSLALRRRSAKRGKVSSKGLTSLRCSLELLLCGRLSSCTISSSLTFTGRNAKGLICRGNKQTNKTISSHALTSWTKPRWGTVPREGPIYGYISDMRGIKCNPKSCSVITADWLIIFRKWQGERLKMFSLKDHVSVILQV